MKTIIRIEHSSGFGIWRAMIGIEHACYRFSFYDDMDRKHIDFPPPIKDSGITRYIGDDEFCAFKSLEQLRKWVNSEWIDEMLTFDFKVLLIDVSECIEGEYQIIFKKEHILQTKDISDLFKTK
jgi:hypothetical protein